MTIGFRVTVHVSIVAVILQLWFSEDGARQRLVYVVLREQLSVKRGCRVLIHFSKNIYFVHTMSPKHR